MRSDVELVTAWRAGDRAAAELLFERHRADLYRFFHRRVGHLADDLVQETLLVCVRSPQRFAGQSSFRTYLFGIARRLLLRASARAAQDRERRFDVDEVDLPAADDWPRDRVRLPAALDRLAQDERVVIELYFWQELTGPEIARALGIPEPTARSRLRRALARLRRALVHAELDV